MNIFDRLDLIINLAVVFLLLLLLVPIGFAIWKKKYWIIITEISICAAIILLFYLFPTRFPYADPLIMGKTRDQIVFVYGEPTGIYDSESCISYDLGKDNGFFGLMRSPNHTYYVIHFDENGRACRISETGHPGG